jgi:hypothetical protein
VKLVVALALCGCPVRGTTPDRQTVPTTVLDPGDGGIAKTVDAAPGHYKLGPGGFPLPDDALPVESSTDVHDFTFEMPRPQEPVVAELKVNLGALGFSIDDEYVAPSGSIHWVITREAKVYKVSVAGQLMRSLLIVTIE